MNKKQSEDYAQMILELELEQLNKLEQYALLLLFIEYRNTAIDIMSNEPDTEDKSNIGAHQRWITWVTDKWDAVSEAQNIYKKLSDDNQKLFKRDLDNLEELSRA